MSNQTYAVIILCVLAIMLGCAVTMVLYDRYWLRKLHVEKERSWNMGWDTGRLCGLEEGKRASVLQRVEDERHAAP